uniref:FeMo cofactor biosynthesis protein NifB n=1 Tax=Paenibacillus polymyxa TaxID=1406 RepID=A0A248RGK8_PAEPO|nr:nitrogen fixation protein [Paenibacillus polymyxa]ASU96647.1 nitrogen fixation protein [Paenibacillus polymyxa]
MDSLADLSETPLVLETLRRHPCYNEEAHRYFARIHLPVAPACNIQCHYCNRKFDCVNESRPGVVSELLTPEQAASKTYGVAAQLMQLSVVGIAGPGDPLANAEATFDTFRRVRETVKDVIFCLSTNGLTLIRHVDRIVELGISHVTITINAVDPVVGSRIYGWVYDEGKRYAGEEAARLLIDRQLAGLKMLASRGVLCKVNSVLIPEVNDAHLPEVARVVKEHGAVLHNIMPLIIAPGSRYEQEGMRAPRPRLVRQLQEQCAEAGAVIMRHCRQCRADAIGLLGEDRNQDFTWENIAAAPPMDEEARAQFQKELDEKVRVRMERKEGQSHHKQSSTGAGCSCPLSGDKPEASFTSKPVLIAVASRGGGKVNQHFGRAKEFMIYESDGTIVNFIGIRKVQSYCHGKADCNGDKVETMKEILSMVHDCALLLSSGIGEAPKEVLQETGVLPIVCGGDIEESILEYVKFLRYMYPVQSNKGSKRNKGVKGNHSDLPIKHFGG